MNKEKRIQIRVTEKQKQDIEDFCKARDIPVSRFCREAIFEKMRKLSGNYDNSIIRELKEKINGIKESIDKKEEMKKEVEKSIEFSNHETQVNIVENVVKEHRKGVSYKTQKTPIYLEEIIKKSKLEREDIIAILRYTGKFKRVGIRGGFDLK